jgi:hypothetical protein
MFTESLEFKPPRMEGLVQIAGEITETYLPFFDEHEGVRDLSRNRTAVAWFFYAVTLSFAIQIAPARSSAIQCGWVCPVRLALPGRTGWLVLSAKPE